MLFEGFERKQVAANGIEVACVGGGRGPAVLPGGHFFVDQFPQQTAEILLQFLPA